MANYPGIDTELLRSFVAIADHGGFTRAAEAVHRTQSAISMQMKRLEEDVLQRPLFERSGRQVSLTAEGQVLLGYARRILKLHGEVMTTLREPHMVGAVRIGTPDDYVMRFLPGILAQFAQAYPLVQVELHCEPSYKLRQGRSWTWPSSLAAGNRDRPAVAPGALRLGRGHRLRPAPAAADPAGDVQQRLLLPCVGLQCAGRGRDRLPHRLHQPEPGGADGAGWRRAGGDRAAAAMPPQLRVPARPRAGLRCRNAASLLRNPRSQSPVSEALAEYIVEGFRL
ncbi:LysR family transcriptional regulator OS=Stutzerimonas stutzeri OX=316 GN=CXK95_12560 PE=3 SV=1 [Stutzerimonas stutzeri]